jgi:serine/threonine protein kinase
VLAPGDILGEGRYEIRGELGKGGMATVYRVRDTRLRIDRALKVLDPQLSARPGLRRRFEVEAHAMAKLSHPNIVRVFDVVDDGTHFYIVMELIDGPAVLELVDEGPVELGRALRTTAGVLRALQAAHDAKIVHRDIKPHNLLIGTDGAVRVSDFGIAQCADFGKASVTRTGAVMGTWAFMAPEQRADAKSVDSGADIYSTGATLFAMVTGLTPPDLFAADIDPAMYQDVPGPIRDIVKKATRYWSWERYGSADEMREDIEVVLGRVLEGRSLAGLDLKLKDDPSSEQSQSTPSPAPQLRPAVEPALAPAGVPDPGLTIPAQHEQRTLAPEQHRSQGISPVLLVVGIPVVLCIGGIVATLMSSGLGPDETVEVEQARVSPASPAEPPPVVESTPEPTPEPGPSLTHSPVTEGTLHEQVVLRAQVTGAGTYDKVTAHYRPAGTKSYRSAKMTRAGKGFRGYLPMDRTMRDGIEYYIEASAYVASLPTLRSGSAARPHRLTPDP